MTEDGLRVVLVPVDLKGCEIHGRTDLFLTTCCTKLYLTFVNVKWLTIILALYLLGLSLWPCADEMLSKFGQESTVVLTKADIPYPGSSHEHHDQCTPFCTCTCCATIITVAGHFSYSIIGSVAIVPLAATNFRYTSPHWADMLSAIWQPPKLKV